jgi:hypothetical protein
MEQTLLPLSPHDHPEPQVMVWSEIELSAIRAYASRCVAAERERTRKALSDRLEETVMSKYANKAECEAARSALRNAMLDVWGA